MTCFDKGTIVRDARDTMRALATACCVLKSALNLLSRPGRVVGPIEAEVIGSVVEVARQSAIDACDRLDGLLSDLTEREALEALGDLVDDAEAFINRPTAHVARFYTAPYVIYIIKKIREKAIGV